VIANTGLIRLPVNERYISTGKIFWCVWVQSTQTSTRRRICCCVTVQRSTWPMNAACHHFTRVSFTQSSHGRAATAWTYYDASLLPEPFSSLHQQSASQFYFSLKFSVYHLRPVARSSDVFVNRNWTEIKPIQVTETGTTQSEDLE